MNEKRLTKKEDDFCRWYTQLRNPREAALKAGYTLMPEHTALHLLSKERIREKISQLEKELLTSDSLISAGLRRLAFGSTADAVKLILSAGTDNSPDIENLDLFNVSEIKYTCGKGMEIKFFDRLKALEKLNEIMDSGSQSSALSFYEAIERSAKNNTEGDGLG